MMPVARSYLLLLAVAPAGLLAGCSSDGRQVAIDRASQGSATALVASGRVLPRGVEAMRDAAGSRAILPEAHIGAPVEQLIYFGGRVLGNVKVWAVNWGPNVNTTISTQIGGFYTAVTASPYFDWLSEYDTIGVRGQDGSPGRNQRIGRGTFAGSATITPVHTATTISDIDIQNELAAQIAAGHLATPETDAAGNVNSLYMFDFPPGMTILLYNGGTIATSCAQYGAYHSTTVISGKSVPYGVHPDCGASFNGATSIHSHELAEAVTDMEVGLVNPDVAVGTTRPSAWYSFINGQDNGEIGDICEGMGDAVVAGYTVQLLWSNTQGACIATAPTIICDGSPTPIPGCRACTAADNGVACNGARPFCETDATNAKSGQCVVCTQSSQCPSQYPTCNKSSDDSDDSCVNTSGCTSNTQCSGTTPICDTGTHQCRSCTAGDCSGTTPACATFGPNEGQCVTCTVDNPSLCTGTTPVCDMFTNKCVGCMVDTDCASVCNLPAHTCAPVPDAGVDSGGADASTDGGDAATDGSTPIDSGADAPGPHDAGMDAKGGNDSGPTADAGGGDGALADSGTGGGSSSGCSCRAAGGSSSSFGGPLLLLGLAAARRRRSRSRAKG